VRWVARGMPRTVVSESRALERTLLALAERRVSRDKVDRRRRGPTPLQIVVDIIRIRVHCAGGREQDDDVELVNSIEVGRGDGRTPQEGRAQLEAASTFRRARACPATTCAQTALGRPGVPLSHFVRRTSWESETDELVDASRLDRSRQHGARRP
jgi:hypothetical protein